MCTMSQISFVILDFKTKFLDSRRIEKGVGEVDKKPDTRGCCSMVLLLTAWEVPTQTATFSHTILVHEW